MYCGFVTLTPGRRLAAVKRERNRYEVFVPTCRQRLVKQMARGVSGNKKDR